MIDVMLPVKSENLDIAEEAIESYLANTDVPLRFIVLIDGGPKKDTYRMRALLESTGKEFVLKHEHREVGLNGAIRELIPDVRNQLVALAQPEFRIDDVRWFGKMQQPFLKDPQTFVVDAAPKTKSTSMPPRKRRKSTDAVGTRFALLAKRALAWMMTPSNNEEPVDFWVRQAMALGGDAWHAPGVRFDVVEHKVYPTWRERSVAREPSA